MPSAARLPYRTTTDGLCELLLPQPARGCHDERSGPERVRFGKPPLPHLLRFPNKVNFRIAPGLEPLE